MIRRSTALRFAAPLLFSVLIAGRAAAWHSDWNQIQFWKPAYQVYQAAAPASQQLDTGGNLASVPSTIAPPPPQLETIPIDRTGHPVNGIPGTYQPKYDEGYTLGYATGYDSGFVSGKERGTSEGSSNGRNDGYNKGWGESYQPAFDSGFNAQLPVGKAAAWNQGAIDGFAEGYDRARTLSSSGSATISCNIYGRGTSGVVITSEVFGSASNFRLLSPDEVPAFYYKLGLDDGNKKGASEGSTAGYKVTYPDAYAAAYPIGYQDGTVEGASQGSADGKYEGYSSGWKLGYDPGFDSGFMAGVQSYLAGNQAPSLSGTLEITLAGVSVPTGNSLTNTSPMMFLGGSGNGSELGSEPSVPEPTSIALLCMATVAISLRRTARK